MTIQSKGSNGAMRGLLTPRLLLFVWGGLGAAFLIYVILSASVQSGDTRPGTATILEEKAVTNPRSLLVGEMADFDLAFPPRGAPEAPFLFEEKELTLADFRGKAVLVNFWATWCAPCLKELPSLDALEGALGGTDFEVVAVAADPRGPEAAREFLDKLEIKNLKLYADPKLRLAISVGGSSVLPVSILYDAEGQEVGRLVGEADWASGEAQALVKYALDRN